MLKQMMRSFKLRKDFKRQSILKTSDRRRSEHPRVLIMGLLLHPSHQNWIECERLQRIRKELIQVFILRLIWLRCEVHQLLFCNDDQVLRRRRIQNVRLSPRTILYSNTLIKRIKLRSSILSWSILCFDLNLIDSSNQRIFIRTLSKSVQSSKFPKIILINDT